MTLTTEDFNALRILIREEVRMEVGRVVDPFREEMRLKHSEFCNHFDELYKRSDRHDVELAVLNKRLTNTDKTMDEIQKGLKKRLDNVEGRVSVLEKAA